MFVLFMFYANHLKNKILIKFKNVLEKLKLLIFKEINYKLQLKFLNSIFIIII